MVYDAVTGEIVDAAAVTLVGTGIETRTAADLLARKVLGITATGGPYDSPVLLRGVNSINMNSEAAIFLDGVRLSNVFGNAMDRLRLIPAADVKEIRVLRGSVAAYLKGSASGAILVETKFGLPYGD